MLQEVEFVSEGWFFVHDDSATVFPLPIVLPNLTCSDPVNIHLSGIVIQCEDGLNHVFAADWILGLIRFNFFR